MKMTHGSPFRRFAAAALGLSAVLVLTAGRGDAADLKLSVEHSSTAAGGSGAFDVYLEVVGNNSVDVSAFSFGLGVASGSGITFTGATDSPAGASYVFSSFAAADRSFDATVGSPATTLVASDTALASPLFATLAAGAKVGLGRVSYSVAPGAAAGDVAVSFLLGNDETYVVGQDGVTALAFDHADGTITVTSNVAVPEPASLVLLGLAVAPGLVAAARKRLA